MLTKAEIINYIRDQKPGMKKILLEDLSFESLVIIKVQIELEEENNANPKAEERNRNKQ